MANKYIVFKTPTILLCPIHSNQNNTHYHISITAVIIVNHYLTNIWLALVLWRSLTTVDRVCAFVL